LIFIAALAIIFVVARNISQNNFGTAFANVIITISGFILGFIFLGIITTFFERNAVNIDRHQKALVNSCGKKSTAFKQ